jgi:hypothetical protein
MVHGQQNIKHLTCVYTLSLLGEHIFGAAVVAGRLCTVGTSSSCLRIPLVTRTRRIVTLFVHCPYPPLGKSVSLISRLGSDLQQVNTGMHFAELNKGI